MALAIMIAGLLTAVSGTTLALAMGLDLSLVLLVYGFFGVIGGTLACLATVPTLRNLWRHGPQNGSAAG